MVTKRIKTGSEGRDFRFWLPAAIAVVIGLLIAGWSAFRYTTLDQEFRRTSVAHWQIVLARLQQPMGARLEAVANNGAAGKEDGETVDRLMRSFPAGDGITLALIDSTGTVLFANRPGLNNRPVTAALPNFDHAVAGTSRGPGQVPLVQVNKQRQLYGYAGVTTRSATNAIVAPTGGSTPAADAVLFVHQDLTVSAAPLLRRLAVEVGVLFFMGLVTVIAVVVSLRYFVIRPLQIIQGRLSANDGADDSPPLGLLGTHAGKVSRISRELDEATATLRDREQRLDRILQSIADGVIAVDREVRVEWLNPVAEALTGWSRNEALGLPLATVFPAIHGRTGETAYDALQGVLVAGKVREEEDSLILTDRQGLRHDISASAAPIFGADGHTTQGAVLTFRDLSDYYRTRMESHLNAIAFDTSAPQLIADSDGTIIRMNQAAIDVSGFSRDDVLGQTLQGFIFGIKKRPDLARFFQTKTASETWTGRSTRRTKKGGILHFLDVITPICNERGELINYVVNFQDVTDLVNASNALQQTEQNYQTLVDAMHDGVLLLSNGLILECNQALCDMLGRKKEELLGKTIAQISPPTQPDGSSSSRPLKDILGGAGGGTSAAFEWSLLGGDGKPVLIEAGVKRTLWAGEKVTLCTIRDISERHQHEQERQLLFKRLGRKDRMTAQAAKIGGIATFEVDLATGMIIDYVGVEEMLNFPVGSRLLSVEGYLQCVHPEDREGVAAKIAGGITDGASMLNEHRIVWPDGAVRWTKSNAEVEYDADGTPLFMRGAFIDITDYKLAQGQIEQLAYYDALTGLANRRLLLDRLRQACAKAQRNGEHGGVLFIDLDRFKLLNDSLGHRAGDDLLQKVAGRLREALRDEDTVARLGGDEFVVVLPTLGTSAMEAAHQAHRVAEKIREMLATVYEVDGPGYYLSGSIGIALFPSDGENAEVILHHADAAMYVAKNNGRNTIAYYEHSLQDDADRRLALEQDLRRAVELEQLELYYQPRIDGGKVVGAEALLRWHHGSRGAVSPLDFIPVAEDTGLIYPLGKWVMKTACNQLAQWNAGQGGVAVSIAVNVSPVQFRHPDFVGCVTHNLRRTGVDPRLLTIEITEGTLIENMDDTVCTLNQLKALGVKVSIDDFGTGYSSLYYLKNLPLDEIKIDQSYIRDILTDASDLAIVDSIIAIADNLGLVLVAEGVETIEQARLLRKMGCDCHQGFLYSKAVEATVFTKQFLSAETTNVLSFDRASA